MPDRAPRPVHVLTGYLGSGNDRHAIEIAHAIPALRFFVAPAPAIILV